MSLISVPANQCNNIYPPKISKCTSSLYIVGLVCYDNLVHWLIVLVDNLGNKKTILHKNQFGGGAGFMACMHAHFEFRFDEFVPYILSRILKEARRKAYENLIKVYSFENECSTVDWMICQQKLTLKSICN